ncbi:CAAX prenyl protease-related protein [Thauera sinica]|uniref:CAAX prenyl protease-related protein n=1 Tax=Thauera sinica TaxID=2665146 RepID=A0ABW1AND8_9RHOO|nr:CAAX prenyl protease-related protein [Thauera sp. K11]ATE60513.1 CAAX prenyl protease-related protein [Thauera sp. K11]
MKIGFFRLPAPPGAGFFASARGAGVARALPFAIYMAMLALGQALAPAPGSILHAAWYPLQIGLTGLALVLLWPHYAELHRGAAGGRRLPAAGVAMAVALGLAVFGAWVNLDLPLLSLGMSVEPPPAGADGTPDLRWLAVRVFGAAVVVPLMEELFWRSFITRWIDRDDFRSLAPAAISLRAALLGSLVFGVEHTLWFAGLLAGLAYVWLYRRSGSLWLAVLAHGTTNLVLGLWVIATGNWQFW